MIGTGRVWETSAISAPRVITISTPSASAAVAIVSEKVRQRRFGSVPSSRTRSRSAAGRGRRSGCSPASRSARLALGEDDRRPGRLEVEELLGVDLGDQLGVERVGDRAQRRRGGRGGVVPAAKRADEDRRAKLRQVAFPGERIHVLSVDDGRARTARADP